MMKGTGQRAHDQTIAKLARKERKRRRRENDEEIMGGGTEAFPDLGAHCQQEDCNQLDFLPFNWDGCQNVFCFEHRTYKAHSCPKSEHNSRTVVICEACSMSIEKKFEEDEKVVLTRHEKSGSCDPAKKLKPRCPVKRCKEVLTFSNCNTRKKCGLKVCLKHRFPTDHMCKGATTAGTKLPVRLLVRTVWIVEREGGCELHQHLLKHIEWGLGLFI